VSIDVTAAEKLLARWWCAYDAGEFDDMPALLDEDVHFQCRTDTGTTSFEEFVRAEGRGRDKVMRWQTQHRLDSPFPLRHNITNFHFISDDDEPRFRHYLSVTQVKDVFPTPVPGGVVEGAVRRQPNGALVISDLVVVLDTMDSVTLRELRS
jgi:hypothetical protein